MKIFAYFLTFAILGIVMANESPAQESRSAGGENESSQEADREQLRQLRDGLTEAVLAGDVEKQMEYVSSDVVTIWQNNQVALGHDGVRDFLSNANSGGENVFQGYTERPTSDQVTILPGGNSAIAFGKSVPHFNWLGQEFDVENRWSATLLKTDGQWKLITYHVSGNLVDNPLLTTAKMMVYWAAGISLVVGILLGAFLAKLMGKRHLPVAQ